MITETDNSTIDALVRILRNSRSILFITGAGVSAESGIPTYRGIGGLYNVDTTEDGVAIEEAMNWHAVGPKAFRSGPPRRRQQLAATGIIIRFELSTEFTRWKQRLDARYAASTGMKPVESLAHHGMLVAANYRPTGIKPVVAKNRGKCFTALPNGAKGEWRLPC